MGTPVDAGNLTGNSSARRWRRFAAALRLRTRGWRGVSRREAAASRAGRAHDVQHDGAMTIGARCYGRVTTYRVPLRGMEPNFEGRQMIGRTPAAIAPAGFALCMRSHSEPKFADPSTSTGVGLQIGLSAGIAWSSPSFERVQSACKSLLAGVAQ